MSRDSISEDTVPEDTASEPGAPVNRVSRTRPHGDNRRSELVRIAYQLIADNGLEGFRTRRVADAAGIDTGTLHYHYPSKHALIEAVLDHLVNDLGTNRAVSSIPAPADSLELLRSEVEDLVCRVKQSPDQFRVLIDMRVHATRDHAIANILAKRDSAFQEYLAGLLSRGIEEEVIRPDLDLELAASLLRIELYGLSLTALKTPDRIDEMAAEFYHQLQTWLSIPNRNSSKKRSRRR
ncbi:MAG: TetR/AcrR family transcriptional regulator [Blastocatellia bacterium]